MNKYLIEILKIQSSVILPGLGALMVPSQKSGKVVFNQHLKFNDGSLAKFIAEKEGIDVQEAQNQVAKFIREIEAELGKGNSYDMFEFGKFFKNKDGEVDFEMASDAGISIKTEVDKPVKKEKKAVKAAVAKPTKDKVTNDNAKEEKEKKKASAKTTIKAEPKAVKKEKPVSKTVKADKKPAPKAETKKEEADKQSKNKFTPPVEEVKEVTTKGGDSKNEEPKKKVEEIKEETIPPVEAKKEEIKKAPEKVEEKTKVIPPVIAEKKPVDDKQNKNTFVPPVTETKEKVKPKVAVAATSTTVPSKKAADKLKEEKFIKAMVKEEKKKRSKLPWIILLILLIGLGSGGYFFKDKIMAFFDKDQDTELADNGDSHSTDNADGNGSDSHEVLSDTLATEEHTDSIPQTHEDQVTEESVQEEPVVEESTHVVSGSTNGNYNLIGNSFGEKSNAERYMNKMQEKGYPAKILGRFDGLYLVAINSYDSRSDANAGRKSSSSDAESAWIFKYPK